MFCKFKVNVTFFTHTNNSYTLPLNPKRSLNFPFLIFTPPLHLPLLLCLTSLLFLFRRVFGARYQMMKLSYPTTQHKIQLQVFINACNKLYEYREYLLWHSVILTVILYSFIKYTSKKLYKQHREIIVELFFFVFTNR